MTPLLCSQDVSPLRRSVDGQCVCIWINKCSNTHISLRYKQKVWWRVSVHTMIHIQTFDNLKHPKLNYLCRNYYFSKQHSFLNTRITGYMHPVNIFIIKNEYMLLKCLYISKDYLEKGKRRSLPQEHHVASVAYKAQHCRALHLLATLIDNHSLTYCAFTLCTLTTAE